MKWNEEKKERQKNYHIASVQLKNDLTVCLLLFEVNAVIILLWALDWFKAIHS